MTLQMEISQVNISQLSADKKMDLADDVMRLLQVREKNKEMTKDWLLFISTSNFKITAGEIYLAFKMALSRELLDSKGNEIDLFPELSNNATGKVISAYLRFKNESDAYHKAREKLKLLANPEKEISETERKKIRNEFLKMVFEDLKANEFSPYAWQLYEDLEKKGLINIPNAEKKELYNRELAKYKPQEIEEIRAKTAHSAKRLLSDFQKKIDSGKPLAVVQNICRSIIASDYLKNYLSDFETFKKQTQ